MKRDMELIRDLMLRLEEVPPGKHVEDAELLKPGEDTATVRAHLALLKEHGFIEAVISQAINVRGPAQVFVLGITWEGHEFIDAARNDTVWRKAKDQVSNIGGSVSLGVMQNLMTKIASGLLGL